MTESRFIWLATAMAALLLGCAPTQPDPRDREAVRDAIAQAAEGEYRSDANRARNQYRNPVETLDFFGLDQDMTVVELWPGGGWYTEILAPVMADNGKLIAANFDPDSDVDYQARIGKAYLERLATEPGIFGKVETVPFDPPRKARLGEPNSADLVVSFRSLHGWVNAGVADDVFRSAMEVLRPGGHFGIVQHRAPSGADTEEWARQGYVPEDYVVRIARNAGFHLAESSEINANPRDTRDHEYGVWTLPPSFRACRDIRDEAEKQSCMDHYRAIGESDRMTLLFVKPE
ncbi:class I SAM-dependent methyltransferase [Natronospira bacteriovora]|uniref:Methyltransferase n=1 Tax=Natronospira bacteriovora TaxID=3069753 RepID=A0ABU0W3G4_9GAMM|nr:methyltransferase [Natronospira sp. AB-CW4]MDQ2068559.1 methyltransferase [Natronospira sp. AB-CW4]